MFVRAIKAKGTDRHHLYFAESYRDSRGKTQQRLLRRIGVLEDLEKEEPGVLGRLKAEAKAANTERAALVMDLRVDLSAPADHALPENTGHLTALAVFDQLGIGPHLQNQIHQRVTAQWGREATLVFYDVTNYHFTSDAESGPRHKGCSKQHQPTPIIQMGLFMDSNGIPICYRLFKGNVPDCVTLVPILQEVKDQFRLGRIIIVADKAMNSGHNTSTLAANGDGWVFSKSARAASRAQKSWLLDPEGWETDPKTGARSKSKTQTRVVKDHDGAARQVTEKILARHSPLYAARDAQARAGPATGRGTARGGRFAGRPVPDPRLGERDDRPGHRGRLPRAVANHRSWAPISDLRAHGRALSKAAKHSPARPQPEN
jgi:hypothetical protein